VSAWDNGSPEPEKLMTGQTPIRVEPGSLPYRQGVGIVLINGSGEIFIGRRCEDLVSDEVIHRWQMPQGGIDGGEDPATAALRELWEETGVRSVEILAETRDWIAYDLPREAVGIALKGLYRGQRQKWYVMRFTGDESEIDLAPPGGEKEFDAWRWAKASEVKANIVPFKQALYDAVLTEFQDFLRD
jgi:putative (di)nucleoside polyphosphate hydrolase